MPAEGEADPAVLSAALQPLPFAGTSATATERRIAVAVLDELNAERDATGLAPLVADDRLGASAYQHNVTMAQANQLSHQLPGEASLGARISSAGYRARAAAENAGWNSDMTTAGAIWAQKSMFAEGPGSEYAHGHYLNIVNPAMKNVGISITLDQTHGKLWLTVDFGG
ncbi:MAG: CAP domain-containing protein [Frankiaceae bacterium]|nr:CAP domain-containing protein [Frankiaceae bacterium]